MSIEIRHIHKKFDSFTALNDVSLDIESGELVALLGPSGCGKTTLLRIIAGLETADTGSIGFSGEDNTHVHVRERQVGFVFQHYALFRHMTVFENVAFGLRVRPRATRPSEVDTKRKVHELLDLVQLDWLADRYPSQLSGGQRQRAMIDFNAALSNDFGFVFDIHCFHFRFPNFSRCPDNCATGCGVGVIAVRFMCFYCAAKQKSFRAAFMQGKV